MYARVENDIIAYLISDDEYKTICNKEDFKPIKRRAAIPERLENEYGVSMYTYKDGGFELRSDIDSAITSVQQQDIRKQREKECFPVINRGALWYNKLTETQKQELSAWYEEWLDAPETGVIPTAPAWLDTVSSQKS